MWVLVATLGLAPALIAVLMVANVVVAPLTWWRAPAPEDEDEDDPTPAGHRRAAWLGGLAVGLVELGLLAGLGAMVGTVPWAIASGAAFGAAVGWATLFVRIPPYAGFSVAPAVVAASLGGGVGALVSSAALWVVGG